MQNQANQEIKMDEMGQKSFFTHASGLKTAFDLVETEEGSDTILVFFHGNQSHSRSKKALQALAKALGFKISGVSIDIFGDAESDGIRGEITCLDWYNQAREFVREYLQAERGFKKFYFVGMSVGGFICTLLLREAEDIMQNTLGVLLIAPAWDFPLYKLPLFSMEQMVKFKQEGTIDFKNDPTEDYFIPISMKMIETAEQYSILKREQFELLTNCFVVWGKSDTIALPNTFETFKSKLIIPEPATLSDQKVLNISWVPMGKHDLSRETDMEIIGLAYDSMFGRIPT